MTNVSVHGFWLLMDGREIYLPFAEFPWFRDATIAEISLVERPSKRHLFWPRLDVDLSVDSLEDPARYPLVSAALPAPGHARERPPRYRHRKRR